MATVMWAWKGCNRPIWYVDSAGDVRIIDDNGRPKKGKRELNEGFMTVEDMDNCDNCIRTYWWWISYANTHGNLGCAVVAGTDSNAALINARSLGIAPRMSDVKMHRLEQDYSGKHFINKLLTPQEALDIAKTIA